MGQQANSGRHASLDDKKQRAAGRQQNDPAMQEITDRQPISPVPGAFGSGSSEDRRGGGNLVTGETSGAQGGAATEGKGSTEPFEERDNKRK
jgi:hypothetical protein